MARLSLQHKFGGKYKETVIYSSKDQFDFGQKHRPPLDRSDDRAWKLVDLETNETIESYTPAPRPPKPKPMSRKGSWMEWVKNPEAIRKLIAQQPVPAIFATRENPGNCIFLNPTTAL